MSNIRVHLPTLNDKKKLVGSKNKQVLKFSLFSIFLCVIIITLSKITSPTAFNYYIYIYVPDNYLVFYTINNHLSYCYFIVTLFFNLHTISTQVLFILGRYLLPTSYYLCNKTLKTIWSIMLLMHNALMSYTLKQMILNPK